ncbi:MAG: hypothetical protein VW625_03570 [Perlucidibaca sp.]
MNSLASFLTLVLVLISLWALIVNPSLAGGQTPTGNGELPRQ